MSIYNGKTKLFYQKLLLLTLFGVLLLAFRIFSTETIDFTFLLWNLFLAAIPLFLSKQLLTDKVAKSKVLTFLILFFWILFLPNSSYIITDLIHLDTSKNTVWLDLLLLFVFSLNGLLLGILSMIDVLRFVDKKMGTAVSKAFVLGVCFLSGFGIFLGRFLRFNSWDIVTRPKLLLQSLYNCLYISEAWVWTFAFGSFIWVSFWILQSFIIDKPISKWKNIW